MQGGSVCPNPAGCPSATGSSPNQPHQPPPKSATPTSKPTVIPQDWKTKYNILIGFPEDLPDGYSEWLARSIFCLVAPGGCGPGVGTVWAGVGRRASVSQGVGRCGRLLMPLTSICRLLAGEISAHAIMRHCEVASMGRRWRRWTLMWRSLCSASGIHSSHLLHQCCASGR